MGNSATKEELKTMATTAGVSEEELLECPVCFQNMLDRQPRALNCLHTFCEECLLNIKGKNFPHSGSISCPTCRQFTTLPTKGISGLPSNFMLKEFGQKLKDMIGSQQRKCCQKCEGDGKTIAGSRVCLDCGFYLCGKCTENHIKHAAFAAHIITDQIENAYCNAHKQFVKFYCNTCNITICAFCASDKKHEVHTTTIKPISESTVDCATEIAKYKDLATHTLHALNDKVQAMESRIEAVKFSIKEKGESIKQQVDASVADCMAKLDKLHRPMDEKTEIMAVKQVQLMQVIEDLSSKDKVDIRTLISLKNNARTAITSGQDLVKSNEDEPRFIPDPDISVNIGWMLGPEETDPMEDDTFQVYVEQLPNDSNDVTLKELFHEYKTIVFEKVLILRTKRVGIVCFRDKNEALKAVKELNGKTELNKTIHVGLIHPKLVEERTEHIEDEALPTKNNLYVKNIDHRVDDDRLKVEFEIYGEIVSAKVMYDGKGTHKGFGFVCFKTDEAASEAISKMNGRKLLSKSLYVALHQTKEERKALLAKKAVENKREGPGVSSPPPPGASARGFPVPLMALPQHYTGLPYVTRPPVIMGPAPSFNTGQRPPGYPMARSGYPVPNQKGNVSDVTRNATSPIQENERVREDQVGQPKRGRRPRSSTPNRKTRQGATAEPNTVPRKSEENHKIAEGLRPQIQASHPALVDEIISVLVQRDKEELLQMLLNRNKLMSNVSLIVATLKHR